MHDLGTLQDGKAMAKHEAIIKNEYGGDVLLPGRFEKKYLKFIEELAHQDPLAGEVSLALKSRNIERIESSMIALANSIRTNVLLIGLVCFVVECENIYKKAGYRSYLEYSQTLFEKLQMSNQSLSDAKNIMGAYIDHRSGLERHNFRLERNAHKLKYIDEAISNHDNLDEIYDRATNSTYREFVDWAQAKKKELPPPMPKVKIVKGRITVGGKKYEDLPEIVKKTIERDFVDIYAIRSGGNEAVVVSAYDTRKARLLRKKIDGFLKEIRAKR